MADPTTTPSPIANTFMLQSPAYPFHQPHPSTAPP